MGTSRKSLGCTTYVGGVVGHWLVVAGHRLVQLLRQSQRLARLLNLHPGGGEYRDRSFRSRSGVTQYRDRSLMSR